jgi:uncharacterized protein YjiS (DUF1127 family)
MNARVRSWSGEAAHPASISAALLRALASWRRRRSRRRTLMLISELDEHVLADIGINPADVRRRQVGRSEWLVAAGPGMQRLMLIDR